MKCKKCKSRMFVDYVKSRSWFEVECMSCGRLVFVEESNGLGKWLKSFYSSS